MKIKLKSIFAFATLLGLICYLGLVTWFNGVPEVMMNETQPMFVSQCISSDDLSPLDRQGELSVAVWNIYKQKRPQWSQVLTELNQQHDLLLLQEARLNHVFIDWLQQSQRHVVMAKGFKILNTPMGVMNIATNQALDACAYQTTEPWIRFAKSTLVANYALSNGQQLLVVNLHGLNFDVKLARYKAQWQHVAHRIALHRGPIILAGDFNTWRAGRMQVVTELTDKLKLKEIKYQTDVRQRVFGWPLDHIYYRGLNFVDAKSMTTSASDHNPIMARFTLNPAPADK
nr:endonuclease/exonuclease/phosphatase family protein [Shewanella sp. Isolate11]